MKHGKGTFRYQVVAGKMEALITRLNLQPGDRMPSVRTIQTELNVSASTVFHAYHILEAKGAVISRPRSGFFVESIAPDSRRNDQAASTNKQAALPDRMELNGLIAHILIRARDSGLVNFAISAPANEYLPISGLGKCVVEALQDVGGNSLQYPSIDGHPKLVWQIARKTFDWHCGLSASDILVTNGCIEAINLCLDAVSKPGDTIIVESPGPYGILQSAICRGLKVVEIPLSFEGGVDLDQLQTVITTRKIAACVFTTRCNTPVGSAMPEEKIIALLDILSKAKIPLIEDDALGELVFPASRSLPAKAYDRDNMVLYCTSFSKSLGPGFRIGWVSGGVFHQKIRTLKYTANFFTNGVLQDAIARFMEKGLYGVSLKNTKNAIQWNLSRYLNSMEKHFPDTVKITKPSGGLSIWVALPESVDAFELTRLAFKEGIGILPGHIFSLSADYCNCIRVCYGLNWNSKIDGRIQKLGRLIENCTNILTSATV